MRRRTSSAFTLVELLVVITLMAIIAGAILTQFDSTSHDRLLASAQIVAADISRARDLAVTNNSSYKLSFNRAENRYSLTHSGANDALDLLPTSPFHSPNDPATEQTTRLNSLPAGGVQLAIAEASDPLSAGIAEPVSEVEFGPLGETTRASRTTIWLSTGTGKNRRFISIGIDPITGLASIGRVQTSVPASLAIESSQPAPELAAAE